MGQQNGRSLNLRGAARSTSSLLADSSAFRKIHNICALPYRRGVASILAMIRKLEAELDVELARRRLELCYTVDHGKVAFEEQILKFHRRIRRHRLRYLLDARPAVLLTAGLFLPPFCPLRYSIYR
jgi:hypothetical protein